MGGCLSDVKGGKEAIGGRPPSASRGGPVAAAAASGSAEVSEAVDFFYQSHGLRGLYSQLEEDGQFFVFRFGSESSDSVEQEWMTRDFS